MKRIKNNLLSYFGNKKMNSTSKLSTFMLECPFAVKWEIEEEKLAALKEFNSGMKEAIDNKMEIIDFSYEVVDLALELLYDRKPSTLTMEEKMNVLPFFDKYCIMDLKDLLECSLAENISLATVVQISNFSLFSNSSNLQQRCMDFIIASFRMNQLIDDFDDLDETFALKVLKHSYYNVIKS